MLNIEGDLPYNRLVLLETIPQIEGNQVIYLEKSYFKFQNVDQYFLKIFYKPEVGERQLEGYIYFYLDFENKTSDFIGMYIKPEYRGLGLASKLIASWIDLCLQNGYYNLSTIKQQRKPFLLYLLKKFDFEIPEPGKYSISPYTISLYQDKSDSTKYLHFKIPGYETSFQKSTIMREDNYAILTEPTADYTYLDQVLLSNKYDLQDANKAYARVLKAKNK